MKNILISVIVPVYKVEAYLSECIESIRKQTYQSIELILIDDGSPDNCPVICDNYAKIDNRIVVIHQKNSGVSSARNAGIKRATGDYIGFVDADDIIAPQMYQAMLIEILNNNTQMCVCTKYRYNNLVLDNSKISEDILTNKEAIQRLLQMNFPTSLCSCLYENRVIKDIYLNEQIHYWEDFEYQLRVLNNVKQISICSYPWYHYRQREGSANHQSINDKVISCMKIAPLVNIFISDHYPELQDYSKNLNVLILQILIGSLSKSAVVHRKYYKIVTSYSRKYFVRAMKSQVITIKMKMYITLCTVNSIIFLKLYQYSNILRERVRKVVTRISKKN